MKKDLWKISLSGILVAGIVVGLTGCGSKDEHVEETMEYVKPAVEKIADTGSNVSAATVVSEDLEDPDASGMGGIVIDTTVEETKRQVDLRGKKFSILGDSICSYVQWVPEGYNFYYPSKNGELTDVSQMWWSIFSENTGMRLAKDGSSSGSMCVGDSTSGFDHQVGCDDFRTSDLQDQWGNYPHIIFVYMGTNDLLNHSPMGDNDGTRSVEEGVIENFSDAYTLMLDKLMSNYASSQIYCCTLLQVGEQKESGAYEQFVNEEGLTSLDYSEKITEIATAKGWPVVDLYNCGIDMGNLPQYSIDGVHPNADGMVRINEVIEASVIENCRY